MQDILKYIFPISCIGCQKSGDYICSDCMYTILPHPPICPVCHRDSIDYQVCISCKSSVDYDGIMILYQYTDIIKKLILKLKFLHKYDLANFLAQRAKYMLLSNHSLLNSNISTDDQDISHIYSDILDDGLGKSDNEGIYTNMQDKLIYLSYVPSHWIRKYRTKGYNQSELLCKKLSHILDIPMLDISYKHKNTKTQTGLKRVDRLNNLIDVFKLKKDIQLRGDETIVIVDDITTTGSTIQSLASTIKSIYPDVHIWGLVIGRSNK